VTVQIRDSDGTVRLSGDLLATGGATGDVLTQQADGTYTPAAGGSPTTHAEYDGFAVTIASGASGDLTWDEGPFGDNLLNLTVPAAPTIITAGVYAVSVNVRPNTAMTAGGFYRVKLDLDLNGADAVIQTSVPVSVADAGPTETVTGVYYIPAAGVVRAQIFNGDGVNPIDFILGLGMVQRLA
jgi:hypothetical protein